MISLYSPGDGTIQFLGRLLLLSLLLFFSNLFLLPFNVVLVVTSTSCSHTCLCCSIVQHSVSWCSPRFGTPLVMVLACSLGSVSYGVYKLWLQCLLSIVIIRGPISWPRSLHIWCLLYYETYTSLTAVHHLWHQELEAAQLPGLCSAHMGHQVFDAQLYICKPLRSSSRNCRVSVLSYDE